MLVELRLFDPIVGNEQNVIKRRKKVERSWSKKKTLTFPSKEGHAIISLGAKVGNIFPLNIRSQSYKVKFIPKRLKYFDNALLQLEAWYDTN